MRVVASIGVRDYVDGFFVVWLREQEKTIAWLREIDMREIQKQMMMNDCVEIYEKLRDCVEMKNDHRVMFWEHGTGK